MCFLPCAFSSSSSANPRIRRLAVGPLSLRSSFPGAEFSVSGASVLCKN